MVVTNIIREVREALNMTQTDLAECVGVSRQTIISIEKGAYNPSLELAFKLSKHLSKPIDTLFILEDSHEEI